MNDFEKHSIITLNRYKRKRKSDPLLLTPIFDLSDTVVGFLRPITADFRESTPHYVKLLNDWRRDNPTVSLSTFVVTEERTKRWLETLVIDNDDRLLFMITDLNGLEIGHLGFGDFDYDRRMCAFDNMIRGVKGMHPGIMTCAFHALMRIAIDVLGVSGVSAYPRENNPPMIRFFARQTWKEIERLPLYEHALPHEVRWEREPSWPGQEPGKYYAYKELEFDSVLRPGGDRSDDELWFLQSSHTEAHLDHMINHLKRMWIGDPLLLTPIYDADEHIIGFLQPITEKVNEGSPDESVPDREDRVRFMLVALDGHEISHAGFKRIGDDALEFQFDALERGVKDVHAGFINGAYHAMMRLGIDVLNANRIVCLSCPENQAMIVFLEEAGWKCAGEVPVYKHIGDDEERWEREPSHEGQQSGNSHKEFELRFEDVARLTD